MSDKGGAGTSAGCPMGGMLRREYYHARIDRKRSAVSDLRYAVIGESKGYPILYHMNQSAKVAEHLRARREASIGRPCFVVPMADWHADPLGALRRAQGLRTEGA